MTTPRSKNSSRSLSIQDQEDNKNLSNTSFTFPQTGSIEDCFSFIVMLKKILK